ncbi:hypothetical protein TBK1r_38050 [Stieleria magnilauensis]|uniref:Uncharacterized protein n=1 Tax=Stieleria magnilauensis TaxID=2527963 RepID=A0ABX5XS88_9BACT|nr:hypothetical protein TBK1r_38050 [Planctomycetes bacterium TBK1r]
MDASLSWPTDNLASILYRGAESKAPPVLALSLLSTLGARGNGVRHQTAKRVEGHLALVLSPFSAWLKRKRVKRFWRVLR